MMKMDQTLNHCEILNFLKGFKLIRFKKQIIEIIEQFFKTRITYCISSFYNLLEFTYHFH
jgi:hypothetical protein